MPVVRASSRAPRRARVRSTVLVGLAVVLGVGVCASPALAYRTLRDVDGLPEEVLVADTLAVSLDPTGLSELERELLVSELRSAVEVWSSVDCAPALLSFAGEGAPGAVQIRMLSEWETSGLDPDATATTELVLETEAGGRPHIVEAIVFLNPRYTLGPHPQTEDAATPDARAVFVHELGHVLGLAHVCEGADSGLPCNESHREATMFPTYTGAQQANLGSDDVEGLCTLYRGYSPPVPQPECVDSQDCAAPAVCIDSRCVESPGFGSSCTDGRDCHSGVCLDIEEADEGICTTECADSSSCPMGLACYPVTGESRNVCAPPVAGGCSVATPGRGFTPLGALLLLLLGAMWRRRPGGLPFCLLAGALTFGVAGCDGSPAPVHSGTSVDAEVATDAEPGDAGEPPDAEAPVDAFVPECMEGEGRTATCGFCGTRAEMCSPDGLWEPTSDCLGEGQCAVADVETEDLGMCQTRQRICLDGCMWSDWEETTAAGECEVGDVRMTSETCPAGEVREETCSASCAWEETMACADPCGGTARTSPDWASEVCVPAGPFVRGSTTYADTQPVAEVYVSSFYMDTYPVTNRRYRQCVIAGACTRPDRFLSGGRAYDDPTYDDHPVTDVDRPDAVNFCAWDGGRRLPTEAEWEKAVRGPAPRANIFPWDGTAYRCDLAEDRLCGRRIFDLPPDPYNGLPGSRSYYGTFMQYGGVDEWVSDLYAATYYSDPASLRDPIGPASGRTQTRGRPLFDSSRPELSQRDEVTSAGGNEGYTGFRCARSTP